MCQSNPLDSNLKHRIYCVLITLLAAGRVLAEDDVPDVDPNAPISLFGWLQSVWSILSGLFGF